MLIFYKYKEYKLQAYGPIVYNETLHRVKF